MAWSLQPYTSPLRPFDSANYLTTGFSGTRLT